jgi:hypothetical protein
MKHRTHNPNSKTLDFLSLKILREVLDKHAASLSDKTKDKLVEAIISLTTANGNKPSTYGYGHYFAQAYSEHGTNSILNTDD